jgi:hypothetical protein
MVERPPEREKEQEVLAEEGGVINGDATSRETQAEGKGMKEDDKECDGWAESVTADRLIQIG